MPGAEEDPLLSIDSDDAPPVDPAKDYIGSRLFNEEYLRNVTSFLTSNLNITAIVEELAAEAQAKPGNKLTLREIKAGLRRQQTKIVNEMISDFSSITINKAFAVTIKTLLARLYHMGIHVNQQEVQRLRAIAKEAAAKSISLVFTPCHKSHIDYLVVSYVLYRMGIALPHIAAGDNLNMPLVGSVLRHNGAFFIRREWGGDRLYITIMREYIDYLTANGYNLEAFVEGTRSRTGKLLQPKFGFLKLVMDSIMRNPGRDAIFVPVNIGYDKVIEQPSYVNELMGTPKKKESLWELFNSLNIFQFKWGRVDVRFGQPFSLREFMDRSRALGKIPATISNAAQQSHLLQSLGYRLLGDINANTSIMPTALVGTILLTLRGRGTGRTELIRKVKWLKKEIIDRGGKVAEGRSSTDVLVDRAVGVLKDLIGRRVDILESVYYPLKRFELSYYRNQVIHLFVPECIVSVAMYATIKVGGPVRSQRIPLKSKLFNDVSFLSRLFRFEFVYGSGGVASNLDSTLEKLISSNVAVVGRDETKPEGVDDLWVTLSAEERRTGRETFDFYCFLLWPFIETYWLSAVALYTILPDTNKHPNSLFWIDSRIFMDRAQIFGKTLYYEGDLSYFESVNKETIGNAIGWLKELGVIKLHKGIEPPAKQPYEPSHLSKNNNTQWIALAKEWIPADILPESGLPHPDTLREEEQRERKQEWTWHGPLGEFAQTSHKSIYDDDSSLAITRQRERKIPGSEYYDDESSSIEKLDQLSRRNQRYQQSGGGGGGESFDNQIVRLQKEDEKDALITDNWSQIRPKGKLWEFCENIGRFRREGKNRRDTSTVAIRVLRLAQLASNFRGKTKGKL